MALKAGGSRTLTAKHVILATGARARTIPAIGLEPDGERVWTYREALVPKAAPEVADRHRLRRHRHRVRQLLPGPGLGCYGDRGAAAHPAGRGRGGLQGRPQGLREARPEVPRRRPRSRSSTKTEAGVAVEIEAGGKTETLEADVAIVAVGIVGNVEDLGLEALGVKIDRSHVVTDGHGATSVPGLYAIGDVAGPPWLAHKASHEGVHCVEHIAGLKPTNLDRADPRLHLLRRRRSPRWA